MLPSRSLRSRFPVGLLQALPSHKRSASHAPVTTTPPAGVCLLGSEEVAWICPAVRVMSQESYLGPPKSAYKSTHYFFIHRYIFWFSDGFSCPSLCWPSGGQKQQAQICFFKFILAGTKGNIYGLQSGVWCLEFSVNYSLLCSCIFPPGSHSLFVFRSAYCMWLDDDGSSMASFFS